MRRKAGSLVPLELDICRCAAALRADGVAAFHGYQLAKELAASGQRQLAAYGTLYRALSRLEGMGLLKSRWEDPRIGLREGRPPRRLYTLTAAGQRALRAVPVAQAALRRTRKGWVPA